uniref:Uncharacterized protein n=1 Tax=Trichobilharzia regenti TaxID=157069 RepID=A0AA85JJI6_TRIRE|nr:unnamed protein product [Trichobilharzia regenti]
MHSFDHTTNFPNVISDLKSLNQAWCTANLLKQRRKSLYVYQMIDKWMQRWLKSEVCNEINLKKSYQERRIKELPDDDEFKIKVIKKGRKSAQGRALSANAPLPLKQQKRKEKLIRKALESLPNIVVSQDTVTPSDGISSTSTSLNQLSTSIFTDNNEKFSGVNYKNLEKYKEIFGYVKKHSPSSSDHPEENVGPFDSNEVFSFRTKTSLSDSSMQSVDRKISNTPEKSETNILNNTRDAGSWASRQIRIHSFETNQSESSQTTTSGKRTVITIKRTRFFLPSQNDNSLTSPIKHQHPLKSNTNVTVCPGNDSSSMTDSQKYVSNSVSTKMLPLSNNEISCIFDSSSRINKYNDLEILKGTKLGRDELRHHELQHDIQRSVQKCSYNTKALCHGENSDNISDSITKVSKKSCRNKALKNINSSEKSTHLLWSDNSLLGDSYDTQDPKTITDKTNRITTSSPVLQTAQVGFTKAFSTSPTNFSYATENCTKKQIFKQNNDAALKRLYEKLTRVRKRYWSRLRESPINFRKYTCRNVPSSRCNLPSYSQDRNSMKSTVLSHNNNKVSGLYKSMSPPRKVKKSQYNNNSFDNTNSEKSKGTCTAESATLGHQTNSMSSTSLDGQCLSNPKNISEQNSEKLNDHASDRLEITAGGAEIPLVNIEDLTSSTLSEDFIKNHYFCIPQPADDTSDTFRFSVLSEFLHSTSDELIAYKQKPRPGLATGHKRIQNLENNEEDKATQENTVTQIAELKSNETAKEYEADSLEAVDSLPTSFQEIKAYDSPQPELESTVEPKIIKWESHRSFHRSRYEYQRPFRYHLQSVLTRSAAIKTSRRTRVVSSTKLSTVSSQLTNKKSARKSGTSKPRSLSHDKGRKARRMDKSTRRQPAITSLSSKQSNVKSTGKRSGRIRTKHRRYLQKNKSPRKVKRNQVKQPEKAMQPLKKLQRKSNVNLVRKTCGSLISQSDIENSYQKLNKFNSDMNRLYKIRQHMENSKTKPSNFTQTRKTKLKDKSNSDKRKAYQSESGHNNYDNTYDCQSTEITTKEKTIPSTQCFKLYKHTASKKGKSEEIGHSSSQAQNQPHNRKRNKSQQKSMNKQVKNKKQNNYKLLTEANVNQRDGDKVNNTGCFNERFVQMKNQFGFTAYLTVIPYEIDEIVLPFRANNKIHCKLKQIYSFLGGLDKKLLEDMPAHIKSNIKDVNDEIENTTSGNNISLRNQNRSAYLDEVNNRKRTKRKSILVNCFPEGDVKMQNIKLIPANNNAPSVSAIQNTNLSYPTYLPKINENTSEFWYKLLYTCNDTRLSNMIDELKQITDRRVFAIECKCKCRIILDENTIYSVTALPCMQLRIVSNELKNVQKALSELENHFPNVYKQLVFTERFHASDSIGSSSSLPMTKSFLMKSIPQGITRPSLSTMQRYISIIEKTRQMQKTKTP